jgi:hypothetical protein
MENNIQTELLEFSDRKVKSRIHYQGVEQVRTIEIFDHQVSIFDESSHDFTVNWTPA